MTRAFIIGITALFLLTPVFAAQPAKSTSHLFYGIKGGLMDPDGSSTDPAGNIGAVIGQPIARYFSWEAEITGTIIDGTVGNNTDWDVNTLAGYAVFRTEGKIGFKGKAGVAYWDTGSNDDLSLSLGIGAGFRMGQSGMLDVEFTQIDNDLDFISIGYIFNF